MKDPLIIREFYLFKKRHAQIATLFVVVMGVLLLFTTIFMDMARVSLTKTSMDIAVDSGVTNLGSMLSSHAKVLSDQAASGRAKEVKDGGFWSGYLGEWLGWVITIAFTIAAVVLLFINPALVAGAAFMAGVGSWILSESAKRQETIEAYRDTLKLIGDSEAKYRESTLLQVLAASVNDPVQVLDIHDINQNGMTKDLVNRFDALYEQKLILVTLDKLNMDDLLAAIKSILGNMDNFIDETNTTGVVSFRNFLQEYDYPDSDTPLGLWFLFSEIKEPSYDSSDLLNKIANAAGLYKLKHPEIKTQLGENYGNLYEINEDIWNPDDPHPIDGDDQIPPEPPKNDPYCQLTNAIYEIYYTDVNAGPDNPISHFLDYAEGLLDNSAYKLMPQEVRSAWVPLLYDGTEGTAIDPEGDEIEDRCDQIMRWEEWIDTDNGDSWIKELNSKQIDIVNHHAMIVDEIENLKDFINDNPWTQHGPPQELIALLNCLSSIEVIYSNLLGFITEAKETLTEYKDDFKLSRDGDFDGDFSDDSGLQDKTNFVLNYVDPEKKDVGEAIYVWKDTRGWHGLYANVGDIEVPWVKTEKKKTLWKTKLKIYIMPYGKVGSQNIPVITYRFDEPAITPWWNFYPSGRYNEAKWKELTEEFEARFGDREADIIMETKDEDFYKKVKNFLVASGMKSKADSVTSWAYSQGDKSAWNVNIEGVK